MKGSFTIELNDSFIEEHLKKIIKDPKENKCFIDCIKQMCINNDSFKSKIAQSLLNQYPKTRCKIGQLVEIQLDYVYYIDHTKTKDAGLATDNRINGVIIDVHPFNESPYLIECIGINNKNEKITTQCSVSSYAITNIIEESLEESSSTNDDTSF